jgi:heat shock protein HslJ
MHRWIYLLICPIILPACTSGVVSSDKPLLETTWNLAQLYSEEISYSGSKAPHLRFEAERVSGNDGCNNIFGPYKHMEDHLSFGLLASTRMACPQIEGFDMMFHKTLTMVSRYRIKGDRLELYADDKLVASFVAVDGQ